MNERQGERDTGGTAAAAAGGKREDGWGIGARAANGLAPS